MAMAPFRQAKVLFTRLSYLSDLWWEGLWKSQRTNQYTRIFATCTFRAHLTMAAPSFTPFEHFATNAIHEGQEPEQWKSMAVVPPICTASTFKQFAPADHAVSL